MRKADIFVGPQHNLYLFNNAPPSRLADTIGFINAIARPPDASFHDEMVEQYGRVRRFLPCLLENIEFSATPAGETTLEAIRYLAAIRSTRRQHIDDAPMAIVTGPWKRLCYGKDGHISRQGYLRNDEVKLWSVNSITIN